MLKKDLRVLFIVKKKSEYGISYGLINSASFIVNTLIQNGIESKLVAVVDGHDIDREVTSYKANIVILEGNWCPIKEKIPVLVQLHPKVKFVARIHSKAPFLAIESLGFQFIRDAESLQKQFPGKFYLSVNSKEFYDELVRILDISPLYLPNIYNPPAYPVKPVPPKDKNEVKIGLFGAHRILKNQLEQAIASIIFADQFGKKLKLYINVSKFEAGGESILKNLRSLFSGSSHELIEVPWKNHQDFIDIVRQMDICLNISFSESFSIFAADAAWNNIPIIGSDEISWLHALYKCDTTDYEKIVDKLKFAYNNHWISIHHLNLNGLRRYNDKSVTEWMDFLLNS